MFSSKSDVMFLCFVVVFWFLFVPKQNLVTPVAPLATLWADKGLIMASGITKYPKSNTGGSFETDNNAKEVMG